MNFLKMLFSHQRSSQKETELQRKRQRNHLNTSNPHPTLHEYPRKKAPTHLKKQSLPSPPFLLHKQARTLPSSFLHFSHIQTKQSWNQIEFGDLLGVVGGKRMGEREALGQCYRVEVGWEGEITSLNNIRKGSLDSLVVFLNEQSRQFSYEQLFKSGSRLVLVADKWEILTKIFVRLETFLFQDFKCRLLAHSSHLLICSIFQVQSNFVVAFQPSSEFVRHFKQTISILNSLEETSRLMDSMTLHEYYQVKTSTSKWYFLEKRIQDIKNQLENQRKLKNLEQEREAEEKAEEREEEREKLGVQKASLPIEFDLETEYFKRTSYKQTRQSGSRQPQNSDLYYNIISQYSDSESGDLEEGEKEEEKGEADIPEPPRILFRSKSENLTFQFEEPFLEEEFFTKY